MPETRGHLWKRVLRRGNKNCKDPEAGAQRGSLSVWGQGEGVGPRRCRAHRLFIVTTMDPAPSDRTALGGGGEERLCRVSVNIW